MAKSKKKYYVVWEGVTPGIYSSWDDCKAQVVGYPAARFKSYKTWLEAEMAYRSGPQHASYKSSKSTKRSSKSSARKKPPIDKLIKGSWSVDAACSGNPGVMEYQGVLTETGERIFHKKYPLGTNNIGEFLAIVHALALLHRQGDGQTAIYTDSRNALLWVKKKKAKTTLKHASSTAELHDHIIRAERWLQDHEFTNRLIKWPTDEWGEIPADFGRK